MRKLNGWGRAGVLAAGLGLLGLGRPAAAEVGYAKRSVGGVTVHVITVDLSDPGVRLDVALPRSFPGTAEPFTTMVQRSKPVAAINGTFFCKQSLRPVGDIVTDGKLRHFGGMGTALCISASNEVEIRRVSWGHAQDWSAYRTVLAGGPTLVKGGQVDLRAAEERFRDPHVLGSGIRSAAGVTAANKLLLVSIPQAVSLPRLAKLMIELGCVEAMNLDGGASTAMYYRGKVVLPAGRHLTNVLTVHEGSRPVSIAAEPATPSVVRPAAVTPPAPRPAVATWQPAPAAAQGSVQITTQAPAQSSMRRPVFSGQNAQGYGAAVPPARTTQPVYTRPAWSGTAPAHSGWASGSRPNASRVRVMPSPVMTITSTRE